MDPDSEPTASKLDSLVRGAKNGAFDILYIALPTMARARITELVDRLADSTLSVYMVPDYTNLISIFRLFIQPMISKFAVSNERNSQ